MVGMPVIAIGREGHNHFWHNTPDMSRDLSNRLGGIGTVHLTVKVIQKIESLHPQFLDRVLQLAFTDFA